jgi:hypothetical protein
MHSGEVALLEGRQIAAGAAQGMSEIRTWLETIDLGQYADAFEANEIGMDLLGQVDDQMLKDIGVSIGGQAFGTFALTASSRHSLQDVCNILDRHFLGERTALAEMAIKRLEWKERREKKLWGAK